MDNWHQYEVILRFKDTAWGAIDNWLGTHVGDGELLYQIETVSDRMDRAMNNPWLGVVRWEDGFVIVNLRFQNEHHQVQCILYWGDFAITVMDE